MPQNAPTSSDDVCEHDPLLNDRQLAAIEAILGGSTLSEVATKVGIDRKTLYRWRMHDLAFSTELRERRIEAVQNCFDRLCNLLNSAMDVLERQLNERYAPTSHRAAKTLLSISGLGKAVARSFAPPTAKPQAANRGAASAGAASPPGLPPSTVRALSQAVSGMDLLGLNPRSQPNY